MAALKDDVSLLEMLDLSQVDCLNESGEHPLSSILSAKKLNATSNHLLSDADEQLLLNIRFNQTVRVRSIVIKSSGGDQAPKDVKLFVNRPALGFEECEDSEPTQDLVLSPDDVSQGTHMPLRYVRFQAVNTLHIFVRSNQGGADETRIDAIDVLGVPVETTKDLGGLKNQDDHH